MAEIQPLLLLNVVGLTPGLLPLAPGLRALAQAGGARPLRGVFPALTLPAQASMLTGAAPSDHGVVANGWFRREPGEVRFWAQSNAQLRREPLYTTARRRARERGLDFRCAKLFWWFNQGADVEISVTPKPHYGADGSKRFDIQTSPAELASELTAAAGTFPFPAFWGPMAGIASSRWIGEAAATVMKRERPTLTLVYLPHLDYDLQRFGPSGSDLPRLLREVDDCAAPVLAAAKSLGARVLVVSEYGLSDVRRVAYPNRRLREAGLLMVRAGPFGEMLDVHESRAFCVCDHQVAHVSVRRREDLALVREALASEPGIARIIEGEEMRELGVAHANAGEMMLLSEPDAWLAYPYWLDARRAPDFARTVDIHRKPGYDPCELFFDPRMRAPKARVAWKLLLKKLGFRALLDVISLDASLVRGSHGLPCDDPNRGPVLLSDDAALLPDQPRMTDVRDIALRALGLE